MAKEWSYGENNKNIILSEPPKQRLRITGHRMASVLGLNEYQSEFGAWCEITKLVKLPFEDNKYTIAGKIIEPKLINYAKAKFPNTMSIEEYYGNNFKAYQYNNFINDSNIFGGVMDAVCTEDDMKTLTAIIECKTSSKPHLWENNNVPIEYLLQGAEYVYLKDLDRIVFICAFLQDNDYNHPENFVPDESNTIFVVKKLKDIVVEVNGKLMSFQEVIDYCEEWWHKYIETGISPEFDEKKDKQYLDIIRTSSPAKDNDLDTLCTHAEELKKEINELTLSTGLDSKQKELKTIENAIKEKMIDNLQQGETKMSYRQYKLSGSISTKFDTKKFQQDHPKTYDKYLRETITYRLLENKGEEDKNED